MEAEITQSIGIFDFWFSLHSEIERDRDEEHHNTYLTKLGEYCNWYVPNYMKNPYMMTGFGLGFAGDLSAEEYESIRPMLSTETLKIVVDFIDPDLLPQKATAKKVSSRQ